MKINLTVRPRNGGWQYVISYKTDKWKQTSKQGFKTKAEAKRAGQIKMNEMADLVPPDDRYTFKQVAELMHKDQVRSENTIATYKSWLSVYESIHDKLIDEIKYIDVSDIVSAYMLDHKHNSNKKIAWYGGAVFKYAIRKLRACKYNPFDELEVRPPKKPDKRQSVVLTVEQINDLISKIPPQYRMITALMGFMGLRIGEARGVTASDFSDKHLRVERQIYISGNQGDPKSRSGFRSVPISKSFKAIWIEFPVIHGRLTRPWISTELTEVYQAAGYDIVPHDLRHSYTTNCIAQGIDYKTTAQIIGDKIEMVMSVYSHVNKDMMDRAEKVLENL
jgi:integrase